MFGKKDTQVDLEVFTIYDTKTSSYGEPTLAPNHLSLIREVTNMMSDPSQSKNPFFRNAEDYQIFRIGTYSRKTGLITTQNLEHIANMHDIKALIEPQKPGLGIVST